MLRSSVTGLRFRMMALVLTAVIPALVLLIITAGDQRQKALSDAKKTLSDWLRPLPKKKLS